MPESQPVAAETREAATAFEKLQRDHLTRENVDFLRKVEELTARLKITKVGISLRIDARCIVPYRIT